MGVSGAAMLRFGVFELDLKSGQLRKVGVLVKLQPQTWNPNPNIAPPGRVWGIITETTGRLSSKNLIKYLYS